MVITALEREVGTQGGGRRNMRRKSKPLEGMDKESCLPAM